MTRAEARREILIARELARVRGAEKTTSEIIAEVRGAEYQTIETPEPSGPRVVTYWERGSRWSALRRVVVPEPVEPPRRDSWGRPKW
jgi:hypothetical protein